MVDRRASAALLACLFAAACHPAGMDPNTVHAAASELKTRAQLAQAHLNVCKTDTTKCEDVSADLSAVVSSHTGSPHRP